jgi:hypothetical protein
MTQHRRNGDRPPHTSGPSTLSRLEQAGIAAVSGRAYEAVIEALKRAGVEIEGTTLKLIKKPRR